MDNNDVPILPEENPLDYETQIIVEIPQGMHLLIPLAFATMLEECHYVKWIQHPQTKETVFAPLPKTAMNLRTAMIKKQELRELDKRYLQERAVRVQVMNMKNQGK